MISARSLQVADHLLNTTYPLLKDPKILLGVLNHLHEYYVGLIPLILRVQGIRPFDSLQGQVEQLHHPAQSMLNLEDQRKLTQVVHWQKEHQNSTMEFSRKEKLILCDEHYHLEELSAEKLKTVLSFTKTLHADLMRKLHDD